MTRWQSNPDGDAGRQREPRKGLSVEVTAGKDAAQQAAPGASGFPSWPSDAGYARTGHTHGPNFGRIVAGCPRCAELAAGAEPVTWNTQADRDRQAAKARQAALGAATERAYAAARAQLDTCCQNKISSYGMSTGAVRQVSVRDCTRHGTHTVNIRPVSLWSR